MLFLYSNTTSLLIVDLFPGSWVLEVALNPASQTETLHFHPYLVIFVCNMNHIGGIYFEDAAHWKERFPLLSGRSSDQCERKKDRQKQNGAVLWWQVSSVFFALMLMQSERIRVRLSAAPTLASSRLCFLPSFFSSSRSLSILNVY